MYQFCVSNIKYQFSILQFQPLNVITGNAIDLLKCSNWQRQLSTKKLGMIFTYALL
jgi:hypothetical protein